MALILPFRAVRPRREFVAEVASYPYDVISSEEAREIVKGNPLSFLHVTKAEVDLPADIDPYDARVYERARRNFEEMLKKGVLFQDETPCFYVYRLRRGEHEQRGVGACVHIKDFEEGRVKKHEMTLPDKREDRRRHIDVVDAQTGPIFLTYRRREEVSRVVEEIMKEKEPEYDFVSRDGVSHTLWVVKDGEDVGMLARALKDIDAMYIADGHHRAASGVAVAQMRRRDAQSRGLYLPHNLILAVLFPDDELQVKGYNRVVKDLCGMDEGEFIARLEKGFLVEPDYRERTPKKPHEYGMYLKGRWYRLRVKEGTYPADDDMESLDVSILQKNVLSPILGIHDPSGDPRITFVGAAKGVEELERLVDSGQYAVAFALCPPTVEEMMRVADTGRVMPPKSTWFEPKLRDGILVHLLAEDRK